MSAIYIYSCYWLNISLSPVSTVLSSHLNITKRRPSLAHLKLHFHLEVKLNMQLSKLHFFFSLLSLTRAQYGPPKESSTSTTLSTPAQAQSTSGGTIHKVSVGENNELNFNPSTLTAAIGDSIEFHFFPPTHTVVQSSFEQPCAPVNASAFASGPFMTTTGENKNVFTIEVNTTDPLWYYCAFPGHCQGGMVGVINPP